jgi:ATP/maltotriose-dependent transcriptional regulator MalT
MSSWISWRIAGSPAGVAAAYAAVLAYSQVTLRHRLWPAAGLVAAGLSHAEIAGRLQVSMATVRTHINNLFAKTGVRDRAQAVGYAYRHGIT